MRGDWQEQFDGALLTILKAGVKGVTIQYAAGEIPVLNLNCPLFTPEKKEAGKLLGELLEEHSEYELQRSIDATRAVLKKHKEGKE